MNTMRRLNHWLVALAALALASMSGAASATIISTDVGYNYVHGYMEISNAAITGVSDGTFSGNSAHVGAGSSVTMTGDWKVVATNLSTCPGCIIQQYVAWIPPAVANGAVPTNLGLESFQDNSLGVQATGTFNWTVNAPSIAGTYYVGSTSSEQFSYVNVQGGTGYLMSDPTITNAASFQVAVPEPATLALLGLGLAGLGFSRRKKAA